MGSQNRTRYHQPMNEAAPGPFGLHHGHFYKLLLAADIDFLAFYIHTATVPSSANYYYASYVDVPVRCRIDKIGFKPGLIVSGNIKLGVHGSDANLLPDNMVCEVATMAFGVLTANDWGWWIPTSLPVVAPGKYWVGFICDETYVGGVSGMQGMMTLNLQSGNNTDWSDGLCGIYQQNVGAFNVPNPMVEAVYSNRTVLQVGLKVTVL